MNKEKQRRKAQANYSETSYATLAITIEPYCHCKPEKGDKVKD
jgi:hypothetical protein